MIVVSQHKVRSSNIELLRITAMVLVMVLHADFLSLGSPSADEIVAVPVQSFFRLLTESLSIVCVNVFILISGWFGIRPRLRRFSEFIFQVWFFGVLMYVLCLLYGTVNEPGGAVKDLLKIFIIKDLWFVKSYIVLYIFSPLLNLFLERASKKEVRFFLFAFYCLQTAHGFFTNSSWFDSGYSPVSFIGLYILAGYIHRYPDRWTSQKRYVDLAMYFFFALLTTFTAIGMTLWRNDTWTWYKYTAPFTVAEAVFLFLFFCKLHFSNKVVNWVAISSFAVYLVHTDKNFLHPIYAKFISLWFHQFGTMQFLLNTACWIVVLFFISILVDKLRIFLWTLLTLTYDKVMSKR